MRSSFSLLSLAFIITCHSSVERNLYPDITVYYLITYKSVLISSESFDVLKCLLALLFLNIFEFSWCEGESHVVLSCLFFSMCVCVCSLPEYVTLNLSVLHPNVLSPPLNPSLEQPNRLNAHPNMNLLFRQLTESRSAPVDEILAQNYQYVSAL